MRFELSDEGWELLEPLGRPLNFIVTGGQVSFLAAAPVGSELIARAPLLPAPQDRELFLSHQRLAAHRHPI